MNMRYYLAASVAAAALAIPSMASAQSTGTIDFEQGQDIIVTGTRQSDVGGVQTPDTSRARTALTQEYIERQVPGQTILDTLNQVPGVNFTNNDAYGSSGGNLTMRGFDSSRISLTFDGVPLNDSGNYAIYSNQQIDPELIDFATVTTGSTDIDSPTASASGGTINLRSITPTEDFGVRMALSAGEYEFMRAFVVVNTGEFTPFGTRAFLSASRATNRVPVNTYGEINKQQYNAAIYQPLGGDDFITIRGHYNENRNNFFSNLALRTDGDRYVGGDTGRNYRFPKKGEDRNHTILPCLLPTPVAGAADGTNNCGTEFDRRYNPSNTGNIRVSSRFGLSDNLVLTIDPSFNYVKANGGGVGVAREGFFTQNGVDYTGYINNGYYFGRDVNGDGDTLDQVRMLNPSQTQTHRIGVISSLRYNINDDHMVRLAYTYDRARHRQTGEIGMLLPNGEPVDVFPVNDPMLDANGNAVQKRDRLSYAILHQVSGEYRGEFGALTVNLGVRAPFFRRNLTNYCFTTSAAGFLDCLGQNSAAEEAYAAANPHLAAPQNRILKYNKVLPNAGFVFDLTPQVSLFGNFSQGIQVPGTDNLYQTFWFPIGNPQANPSVETTDNFDLGVRYRSSIVQASLSGWYTNFQNRLASAYDPILDANIYRNLGSVKKWGIDGSLSIQPVREFALHVFGSVLESEIQDNVLVGDCTAGNVTDGIFGCTVVGDPAFAQTAGKHEGGAPTYSFGGSARAFLGPVEVGFTAKRTGPRYLFDDNLPTFGMVDGVRTEIYPSKVPAYWMAHLDARLSLSAIGMNDQSFFQINVYNLFNTLTVGSFNSGMHQSGTSALFANIGAPRTISGTINFAF